jgi:uncharacterized membrane protein HdeD (DUF308 family)
MMSIENEQGLGPGPAEVRYHPGWFLFLGIVLVVLGAISMVAAFAATLATVLFFGVLLLVGGVTQIVHALSTARWRGFLLHLLGGVLYAAIGGMIIADPVSGAIGLTLLLAIFFIVGGVFKIVLGIQAESGWFAFSGLIDLLLGVLVWVGWPQTGTWVIGLFVGIELVLAGLGLIMVASALRSVGRFDRYSTGMDG